MAKEDEGIRISCEVEGFEDCFVLFESKGWTFGDKRRYQEAVRDTETYKILVSKIIDCNIRGVDGVPKEVDDIENMPLELVTWLARGFSTAMMEVMSIPPGFLWQLRQTAKEPEEEK